MTDDEYKRSLLKLFDEQMNRLRQVETPKGILEEFQNQRERVLSRAMLHKQLLAGRIPFLPVIPRSYLGIYGLTNLLKQDGVAAENILEPNEVYDLMPARKMTYFIYDVEDGEFTKNLAPFEADYRLANMHEDREVVCGRYSLTLDEAIALALHTSVLKRHAVVATNSRYELPLQVPSIAIEGGETFVSCEMYYEQPDSVIGTPSCHHRY